MEARLLAADADVADFDQPVRRAREADTDAELLLELEAARSLALTIRSTLQSRRRREAELTALYDTANDLAALHDVDAVLQSIVRPARALIGADVTYLTLNDPQRGDTYMRVTDGSVSAWFQRLRLPLGAGLGGLVAQRAAPYTTASSFTDERFRHTDDISGAVVEEGLVSILGVPLRRGASAGRPGRRARRCAGCAPGAGRPGATAPRRPLGGAGECRLRAARRAGAHHHR